MRCLTGARFSMKADVLRQGVDPVPVDDEVGGEWVTFQDPLTHEITRVWKPYVSDDTEPVVNDITKSGAFDCIARAIVDGGIRVAGTTERFGEMYENVDFIRIWFPPNVILTKRDRVTNIRDRKGKILWLDEEVSTETPNDYKATVFNVNGVSPLFDPFNNHIENVALLERAE